jgi:Hydrazine synthase alpha subunit middle domain
VYDVSHMQFFQGDQVRGIGGTAQPRAGRRVLAKLMHDPKASNAFTGVPSAVAIAPDGSMAALVPARRAMSWQMTNFQTPVVRERYWLSFQPGEVRVCASCHGINQKSQTGVGEPQNPPEGLRQLLRQWKEGRVVGNEDRVFNWAETKFPDQLLPKSPTSQVTQGLRYRFYSATNEYLGAKDGRVFYFKPGAMPAPADVGTVAQYLNPALGEGF